MGAHLDLSIISKVPISYKVHIREDGSKRGLSGASFCACQTIFMIPKEAYEGARGSFNRMINELPQNVGTRIAMDVLRVNNGYIPHETRENYYRLRISASGYESGMHEDFVYAIRVITDRLVTKLNRDGYTAVSARLRK